MRKNIERVALIATIIIIILTSIADLLGLLEQFSWFAKRIPTITLLLLAIAIGYLISEHRKECDQLESIEKRLSLSGGVTLLITTETALNYLAQRFTEAQRAIDQAAIAPSLSPSSSYNKYDQVLVRVLKKNAVKYRHLIVLDTVRWKRVSSFLNTPKIKKYYVKYYKLPHDAMPGLSYAIIDNEEIIMRYPYRPDQSELWLSIKHPEVVQLFVAYFQTLWSQGSPLDNSNNSLIQDFDKHYNSL